jgi:hypothetical protein
MPRYSQHILCAVLPFAGLLYMAPVALAYDNESERPNRSDRYRDEDRYDREDRSDRGERSNREDRYGREERSNRARMSEQDLRSFEHYLDTHDETAQMLYRQPDLINDRRFVHQHEALQDWLANHQEAAEALHANPDQYLWRERNTNAADFLNQLFKSGR